MAFWTRKSSTTAREAHEHVEETAQDGHDSMTTRSRQAHDDHMRAARQAHTPCGHPRCELCNTGQ